MCDTTISSYLSFSLSLRLWHPLFSSVRLFTECQSLNCEWFCGKELGASLPPFALQRLAQTGGRLSAGYQLGARNHGG